jgi:ABC-2 type transport system permease protein
MEKLWLILQREYLTRVKKRSFILTTILTPLAFAVFFIAVGFILSYSTDETQKIAVIDRAGIVPAGTTISNEPNLEFVMEDQSLDSLRTNFSKNDYDGILLIPPIKNLYAQSFTIFYYSDKNPSLDTETKLRSKVTQRVRDYKIKVLNLEQKELRALDSRVELDPEPILAGQEDSSKLSSVIGAVIGGAMGIIMYMTVFIYGMMVMRSVMEEKTSRIVEVMISSTKPFQLMLGKIIGVGAVGLTQLAIWAILIPLISMAVQLIFGFEAATMEGMPEGGEMDIDELQQLSAQVYAELSNQNWWLILPLFIFYFLGGYFLYASLFAAVGSAMGDDLGEGQALTIPITIPVILAFYIMFATLQAPNSNLAVFSSLFPLFSPIVMPSRLAFDPPVWQILTSVVLLAGTSLFFIWLSGRIYRVGILMYGKKVTLKELFKWMIRG